jgi:hypothetical protein
MRDGMASRAAVFFLRWRFGDAHRWQSGLEFPSTLEWFARKPVRAHYACMAVLVRPAAQKGLAGIPKAERDALVEKLKAIANDP